MPVGFRILRAFFVQAISIAMFVEIVEKIHEFSLC